MLSLLRSISTLQSQRSHVTESIQALNHSPFLLNMSSKTPLDIVFGCMTFGREGEEQVRTSNLDDCTSILDTLQSYGHTEVDTSRFYGVRISPLPVPQSCR